jgi:hypothetical protein
MTHEEAFVHTFIIKTKQDRYLLKLASARHRRTFLSRLHHNLDYVPQLARTIPAEKQSSRQIFALLRGLGAPDTCHVIAANSELDGKELPLDEALNAVVGDGNGVVLSCIPGQLAYYESEEQNGRFILEKK